ncbi:MAG: hypothetical protein AB7U72_09155, partial [Methanosarcina sp.]
KAFNIRFKLYIASFFLCVSVHIVWSGGSSGDDTGAITVSTLFSVIFTVIVSTVSFVFIASTIIPPGLKRV